MNGEPLPPEHGFPARLIVPGLYGYVSATKWLTNIELTTLEAFDGYWVPLGWAKEAPILTQSRIDVPRSGPSVGAGDAAGRRRRLGAGPRHRARWRCRSTTAPGHAAELSTPISDATWVQWLYRWDAPPATTPSRSAPPTAPARSRPPGHRAGAGRSARATTPSASGCG